LSAGRKIEVPADALDFAVALSHEAGEVARRHFQRDIAVEQKADLSPVTVADREVEQHLRRGIEKSFPTHGILGEEFGHTGPESSFCWMLDPIDGTRTFIRGVPFWGVMIGLVSDGEPVLGVVHFPALGETVYAQRGGGAWWLRDAERRKARVSGVESLQDSTLVLSDVRGFAEVGRQEALERLRARTAFERTWGDCYGHALVATGRAEVMLDPVLNEWDACALLTILEEAGGRFTDWQGNRIIDGGSGISTSVGLFDELMQVIRGG
jgi:histidinol phosphatase-like enzyme (inositol monophosphatase family)